MTPAACVHHIPALAGLRALAGGADQGREQRGAGEHNMNQAVSVGLREGGEDVSRG